MPKKINWSSLISFLLLVVLLSGCYPTRSLKRGEQWLLKSNSVKINGKCEVDPDQLESIVKQRPNRTIGFSVGVPRIWGSPYKWDVVFLRFNLRAHNLGLRGKTNFFKWLREKVGEEPVIYDTLLTTKSLGQINEFMFQKGYYDNSVSVVTKYSKRKKMIRVAYVVEPGLPYTIKTIAVSIPDNFLNFINTENSKETLLKVGDIYDYEKLEAERQRLINLYQDKGYYNFTREYIRFDVDSSLGTRQVNLTMVVRNRSTRTDTLFGSTPHILYYTRNFFVYPEYDFFSSPDYRDTIYNDSIRIVFNGKLPINEKLVYNNMFFPKPHYSRKDADVTYRSFNSLSLYKNIRVEFKEVKNIPSRNLLDCFIYLSPFKRNSLSTEARLETRANNGSANGKNTYNFGVSGNIAFQRLNAFRNGEILKLSLSAGLQPFFLSDSSANKNFFNTTEIGPTVSVTFPRFLLPISQDKFAKSAQAKTIIVASYNILRNEDIQRRSSRLSLSYEWNETVKKKHIVTPAQFSLVKAKLSSALNDRLVQLGDPFLKNTYSDQFILASSYTFIYSDQYDSKSSKAYYNRSKIEGAGNLLRGIAQRTDNWKQEEGSYLIGGIPFAQYLKIENEFKTYRQTFFDNVVAFRFYSGVAKPFDNLKSLPFETSFFAGGSNGIRAWGARSLGPGGYLDTNNFRGYLNRLGEIHLETNIEYRIKLTKLLEWAFFVDAGNIWVFKERGNRERTEFSTSFYRQVALGAGFGPRLDFGFFIFRFDIAFPIHDPSLPSGERWFYQDKTTYNAIVERYNARNELTGKDAIRSYRVKPNFNIGIGYPF